MRLLRFIFYHLEEITLLLLIPLALAIGLSTYIYFNGEQEKAEEIRCNRLIAESTRIAPSKYVKVGIDEIEQLEALEEKQNNKPCIYRRKPIVIVLETNDKGEAITVIYKKSDFIIVD